MRPRLKRGLIFFCLAFTLFLFSFKGTYAWWNSSYSYRRDTQNTTDNTLLFPFVDEDPDSDSSLSTYYGQNGSIYYNSDGDFAFANDTDQRCGFSTFVDGAKNQISKCPSAPSGLVSYWTLDNDNAWDPISGNDGTLYGGVTTGATGKVKNSYDFDGTDDYVNVGHIQPSTFSVVVWAKFDSLGNREELVACTTNNAAASGNSCGWLLEKRETDVEKGLIGDGGDWNKASGTTTLSTGTWYMMTLVYDGSTAYIYLDDTQEGSVSTEFSEGSYDTLIGDNPSGYATPMDGTIDDVRVYNRSLSATEVQTLYNATKPVAGHDPTFSAEETQGDIAPTVNWGAGTTSVGTHEKQTWIFGNGTALDDNEVKNITLKLENSTWSDSQTDSTTPTDITKNWTSLTYDDYNLTLWAYDNASQKSSVIKRGITLTEPFSVNSSLSLNSITENQNTTISGYVTCSAFEDCGNVTVYPQYMDKNTSNFDFSTNFSENPDVPAGDNDISHNWQKNSISTKNGLLVQPVYVNTDGITETYIMVSKDGGETWNRTDILSYVGSNADLMLNGFQTNPNNKSEVWGSNYGWDDNKECSVWKSNNSGRTWYRQKQFTSIGSGAHCHNLKLINGTLYTLVSDNIDEVWKSNDWGETWINIGPSDVKQPTDIVYWNGSLNLIEEGASNRVLQTNDGGSTWTTLLDRSIRGWDLETINGNLYSAWGESTNEGYVLKTYPNGTSDFVFNSTDRGIVNNSRIYQVKGINDYLYISEMEETSLWRTNLSKAGYNFKGFFLKYDSSDVTNTNGYGNIHIETVDGTNYEFISTVKPTLYKNGWFNSSREIALVSSFKQEKNCGSMTAGDTCYYEFDLNSSQVGEYNIRAIAVSKEKNNKFDSSDSNSLTVQEVSSPNITLESPADGATVSSPVNFTYTPKCYSSGGCSGAELFFNKSTTSTLNWIVDSGTEWNEGSFVNTTTDGAGNLVLESTGGSLEEDGDVDEFNVEEASTNHTAVTSPVLIGSYSREIETGAADSDYEVINTTFSSASPDWTNYSVRVPNPGNGNWVLKKFMVSGGTPIAEIAFNTPNFMDDITVYDGVRHTIWDNYPADTWMNISIKWDWANDQYDVYINGHLNYTDAAFYQGNSASGYDEIEENWDHNAGNVVGYMDGETTPISAGGYKPSGSYDSKTFDAGEQVQPHFLWYNYSKKLGTNSTIWVKSSDDNFTTVKNTTLIDNDLIFDGVYGIGLFAREEGYSGLGEARYFKFNVSLSTNDTSQTSEYDWINLTYNKTKMTWASRKTNQTPVENNSINWIEYNFSEFNLPKVFKWGMRLNQSDGQSVMSSNRTVNVISNNPPNKPSLNNPPDGATGISTSPTLNVTVPDPDGDKMNVSFYNASDDVLIGEELNVPNGSYATTTWNNLGTGTTYEWYTNATDPNGATNQSDTWSFTTYYPNNPPDAPSNPSPSDGATGVSTTTDLSVDVSDPDGDSMDVSFYWNNGTLIEMVTGVSDGGTATTSSLSLSKGTTYSWYAVADDGSATTQSSTWSFTIEDTTPPTFSDWTQDPSDMLSDTMGKLNITVNITDTSGVNASTAKIWRFINDSNQPNQPWHFINGTADPFWKSCSLGNYTPSRFNKTFCTCTYKPSTMNILHTTMRDATKANYSLDTNKEAVKVRFYNMSTEANRSYDLNTKLYQNSGPLYVGYCNSSYTSGRVDKSDYCVEIRALETRDLSHKYQNIYFSSDESSKIGNIKVTDTGYFIYYAGPQTDWELEYAPDIGTTSVATTGDRGVSWNDQTYTANARLFQVSGSGLHTLGYKVEVCDLATTPNCANSTIQRDVYAIAQYAPTPPANIIHPESGDVVNETININWTESEDPNDDPFNYTIILYNSDRTYNQTLGEFTDASGTLSMSWDTTTVTSGDYYIYTNVTDTNGNTNRYIMPENFTVVKSVSESVSQPLSVSPSQIQTPTFPRLFSQKIGIKPISERAISLVRKFTQLININDLLGMKTTIIGIKNLSCLKDGTTWVKCSDLQWMDVSTKIRARVTGDPNYVNFTLYDKYDDHYAFKNINYTSKSGDYYIYDNPDRTINDSGDWIVNVTMEGDSLEQTWSIPFGTLNVSMQKPSSYTKVKQGKLFNMTGNVTCSGGECCSEGEKLSLWADPRGVEVVSISDGRRRKNRVTGYTRQLLNKKYQVIWWQNPVILLIPVLSILLVVGLIFRKRIKEKLKDFK